jgi:hypothetical protein
MRTSGLIFVGFAGRRPVDYAMYMDLHFDFEVFRGKYKRTQNSDPSRME